MVTSTLTYVLLLTQGIFTHCVEDNQYSYITDIIQ